jgi:hypothetical protein
MRLPDCVAMKGTRAVSTFAGHLVVGLLWNGTRLKNSFSACQ